MFSSCYTSESEHTKATSAATSAAKAIQRKLAVGSENDPQEHEADAMADTVMRMPETFIQRKCAACEE